MDVTQICALDAAYEDVSKHKYDYLKKTLTLFPPPSGCISVSCII